ncbi:hypothetical protein [Enterobacter kobei]|uniref:hypothetical protein n=1 Tax=Enterobacter kobei TaxID=208224 RepID=UPI003CF382BB
MKSAHLSDSHFTHTELQARLNAVAGSVNNQIESHEWRFSDERKGHTITIDFTVFRHIWPETALNYFSSPEQFILCNKILWLGAAKSNSPHHLRESFIGLVLFWNTFLGANTGCLTRVKLPEFLHHFMLSSLNNFSVSRRRSIMSFSHFKLLWLIDDWRMAAQEICFSIIAPGISGAYCFHVLKTLIPQFTHNELTYADWVEGASFNSLTLDTGQYYTEHCISYFEKHIATAIALNDTIQNGHRLFTHLPIKQDTLKKYISLVTSGKIHLSGKNSPSDNRYKISTIAQELLKYYQAASKKINAMLLMQTSENISRLAVLLNLGNDQPVLERLQMILWEWSQGENRDEVIAQLVSFRPAISGDSFQTALNALQRESDKAATIKTPYDFALPENAGLTAAISAPEFIRNVQAAGLVGFVALTGWRRSEYDFPYSALRKSENNDILDRFAFPWRYQVQGFTPKTSGDIPVLREITFYCARLMTLMNILSAPPADAPCLLPAGKKSTCAGTTGYHITQAVRLLWAHHITHYEPFIALEKGFYRDNPTLIRASHTGKTELPALIFYFTPSVHEKKKNWLARYARGTLDAEWKTLLDAGLSTETKAWVSTLSDAELCFNINSRKVASELVAGFTYPTPHAFRHMWAEAIYRRFDGDVGWMIRSQFKHISKNMWLAYVKNKDNQNLCQAARQDIISSLVKNYLFRKGEGYAGQMTVWLRKLINMTVLADPQEQQRIINEISQAEITGIKANPWGYCLLRKRSSAKARCANQGIPRRYNAAPELCMSCTHNLMGKENVSWVVMYIQSHLSALQDPAVPHPFRQASFELLTKAFMNIRQYDKNHPALQELQEALDSFRKTPS